MDRRQGWRALQGLGAARVQLQQRSSILGSVQSQEERPRKVEWRSEYRRLELVPIEFRAYSHLPLRGSAVATGRGGGGGGEPRERQGDRPSDPITGRADRRGGWGCYLDARRGPRGFAR